MELMMQIPQSVQSDEDLQEASRIGEAIYSERFRALLEPDFNGQIVAIHLETGDYEVDKDSSKAHLAVRRRHTDGIIMVRDIGIAKLSPFWDSVRASQLVTGPHK
jgi:hypothetical protein